jgi:hypothetical protein
MADFEAAYDKAIEDGLLPGYALLAGDKVGQFYQQHSAQTEVLTLI